MATATKKKPARSAAPVKVRRPLHRVGINVRGVTKDAPTTIGQRLAQRRLALQWTQQQVADKVIFTPKTGKREKDEVVLSRNSYGMYETDGVEPDLAKIEVLATVLGVSAQWLAFGTGVAESSKEFIYDSSKKAFIPCKEWGIDEAWLSDQFASKPSDIALFVFTGYSDKFAAGDVAIVSRRAAPSTVGADFIYAYKNELRVSNVTRGVRSDDLRIFSPDLKKHEVVPANKVVFLGRIVGKMGSSVANG